LKPTATETKLGLRGLVLYLGFHDIKNAIMKASACRPYSDPNRTASPGVSLWRVSGNDLDGEQLDVGIDLVLDHLGFHAAVTTVF